VGYTPSVVRDNVRRFALVACTVTGALTWLSILGEVRVPRASFAIVGLVAAIASALVPRSPRWLAHPIARIALSGCIAFALLGFAVPAARDLAEAGVDLGFLGGWLVLIWLIVAGVLARLLMADLRAQQAYVGVFVGMASIIVFIAPRFEAGVLLGLAALFASVPTLLAAWVTDRIARLVSPATPTVPAARVVQLDSGGDGAIAEGTVSGD
jgi:hypothetical protein